MPYFLCINSLVNWNSDRSALFNGSLIFSISTFTTLVRLEHCCRVNPCPAFSFRKRVNPSGRLLSLALTVIDMKTGGLTPFFLPALGPLLYFYVRQLTCPDQQFRRKDMLHFCPLLVAYWMPGWMVLISVIVYLYLSHRLIQAFL